MLFASEAWKILRYECMSHLKRNVDRMLWSPDIDAGQISRMF